MRGKKDEPLSSLGTKSVRITDKGALILALPSFPTSAPVRGASPNPSMEKVPPRNKRLRAGEKQKKKVDSRPSCVWDDAGVSMARAQETFSMDELKVFSGVPADDVARHHLHKLMQVTLWFRSLHAFICFLFFFFKCVSFSLEKWLEEVDKEMATDKAAQSSAAETDAPENALESGGAAANA